MITIGPPHKEYRMTDPVPGFWMLRQHRHGPELPAAILRIHTTHEPGDEKNKMERSPFLAAFIAGRPVGIERVWHAVKQPISRGRYAFHLARLGYAQAWEPNEPMLAARSPVDLIAMKSPRPK